MSETQHDWIRRVLGVEAVPAAPGQKLLPIFTEAKEAMDAQLDRLGAAFRASGLPAAEAIAEQGLPIITGGRSFVTLVAALLDHDRGGGPATAGKVRQHLSAFRGTTLAENGLLARLERNPLAPISIRAEIERRLSRIEAALPN